MREVAKWEFNWWQRVLQKTVGMCRINRDSIDFSWGYFSPRFGFSLILNQGYYFDQQYSITVCLGWGVLHVKLPFKTTLEESCEWSQYGIQIHNQTLWVHYGRDTDSWKQSKYWSWGLPWFTSIHDSHEIMTGSGWKKVPYTDYRNEDGIVKQVFPYEYSLVSGEVQERTAEVIQERRTWHRKWFPFVKSTREYIDITFSDEVGEESGSWKGGCIGCSYDMLHGETPEQTLRRMEKERNF